MAVAVVVAAAAVAGTEFPNHGPGRRAPFTLYSPHCTKRGVLVNKWGKISLLWDSLTS
jgi:hypothetical protein